MDTRGRPARMLTWTALAVLGGLLAYVPWMGWGMLNGGEYAPWQVIGSGVTFAVAAAVVGRAGHVVMATVLLPTTYTAAFTVAASDDSSGLFVVGAMMVFVGTLVAAGLFAFLGDLARVRPGGRRRPQASETSSA